MDQTIDPNDKTVARIRAKHAFFQAVAAEVLGDKLLSSEVSLSREGIDNIVKDLNIETGLKAYLSGYFNVR